MSRILRETAMLCVTCRTQYNQELQAKHSHGHLTAMDLQMKVWVERSVTYRNTLQN